MRKLAALLAATAVRSLSMAARRPLAMASPAAERRTILVTGSTDGIGKFTAGKLAADGHHVLVHGRCARRVHGIRSWAPPDMANATQSQHAAQVARNGGVLARETPEQAPRRRPAAPAWAAGR